MKELDLKTKMNNIVFIDHHLKNNMTKSMTLNAYKPHKPILGG